MMRSSIFLVMIVGIALIIAENEDLYTDIYDKLDIDKVLGNERVFQQYVNCLLDKGPCTADGRSVRRVLPDVLKTNCARCNPRQKEMARKLVTHIEKEKPEIWKTLTEKFDPKGQYMEQFKNFTSNLESISKGCAE